jgi:hypothetical protein
MKIFAACLGYQTHGEEQGRIGSPNFSGIFFQGAPKKIKNCCQNKNADQKKKVIK